jgi:hypothetical protein
MSYRVGLPAEPLDRADSQCSTYALKFREKNPGKTPPLLIAARRMLGYCHHLAARRMSGFEGGAFREHSARIRRAACFYLLLAECADSNVLH